MQSDDQPSGPWLRTREPARTEHFRLVGSDVGGYYICLASYCRNWHGPYLGWSCVTYSELEYVIAMLIDELRNLLEQVDYSQDAGTLGYPQFKKTTPQPIPTDRSHQGLSLRFVIMRRDGYRCQICGRTAQDGVILEVDHKIPRSKGGTDHPSNLWTLCFDCNRGKRDNDL